MIVIEPYATIIGMSDPTGEGMLRHIERCARTCYKSEGGQTEDSYKKLLPQLMTSAHMSVFEHGSITVEFCIDRGVSHELVRHRMAAYSQESTRYCNYSKDKFGNQIKVIRPTGLDETQEAIWYSGIEQAEKAYFKFIAAGGKPQIARDLLPNALATSIVCTMNPRAWRHLLLQRTHSSVHPKFLQVTLPLLSEFKKTIPIIYDDIDPLADQGVNLRKAQ